MAWYDYGTGTPNNGTNTIPVAVATDLFNDGHPLYGDHLKAILCVLHFNITVTIVQL